MSAPLAAALDLGSTRLKLALLAADGELELRASAPFPSRVLDALRVEVDLEQVVELVTGMLALVPRGTPLGVATQRSTFVLFESRGARPVAPVLSWRDRRAQSWCERNRDLGAWAEGTLGLRLSPHYAGPKVASLCEEQPQLRERIERGGIAFGTLETYLIQRLSSGTHHTTDVSMAARTLLLDPRSARWDLRILERAGVHGLGMPSVTDSRGSLGSLDNGLEVRAALSDQASALVASTLDSDVLVNLGTGGFVLAPTASFEARAGWLCGPTYAREGAVGFALEGTINGGGATLAELGQGEIELDASDDLLCMPDENGWGAPYWDAARSVTFSRDCADPQRLRSAWITGLLFRVRELIEALAPRASRVRLAGGLAHHELVARALASTLGRTIERLEAPESTLLGVARLAAGLEPFADPRVVRMDPAPELSWLHQRFDAWRDWMLALRGTPPARPTR